MNMLIFFLLSVLIAHVFLAATYDEEFPEYTRLIRPFSRQEARKELRRIPGFYPAANDQRCFAQEHGPLLQAWRTPG